MVNCVVLQRVAGRKSGTVCSIILYRLMRWWIGVVNVGFGRLSRPILLTPRSKAWVYDSSLPVIVGSILSGGKDVCLL
jgi:hypothetical protein